MKTNHQLLSKFACLMMFLFIFSPATGQELSISLLRTLKGHRDWVNSVAFSPDGKILASGSDETIKLWDVASGRELRTLSGHSESVYSVAFSPDGKILASGSDDNTIKLWDVASGRRLRFLRGHRHYVSSVAFSPDGKTLASGSVDNTIKLWDVASGRELRTLSGHRNFVLSVAFSPDGKTLASGSNDNTIKLWDVASGRKLRTLTGHRRRGVNWVESVAFSPDGKILASGSLDNTIKLWDVASGWELRTLKGHRRGVYSVAFSPDGNVLASGSGDDTVKLWDISFLRTFLRIYAEKEAQLQALSAFFRPKGEFETNSEYRARLEKGEAEKKAIEEKYAQKLRELRQEYEKRKREEQLKKEQEIQAKIRESIAEVTLSITNVGTYDADTETFPISINNVTKKVKIPRSEARSFKAKWQSVEVRGLKQLKRDLTTWEYFNLVIIHPVTGNQYPFGEQRDITQLASTTPATTTGLAKSVIPPKLSLTARLWEPSGNGFLDAGEQGKVIVEVANSGKGSAFGVIVDAKNENENPDITYSRTRVAGEIPAGQTKTLEFEVQASKTVKRTKQHFLISATESNNFNPAPVRLTFETYPLLLPEITLVDYGITTASGDNVITPGEVVYVKIRVQNVGQGVARKLKFNFNLPQNVFFAPGSRQHYELAELNSGDFTDMDFSILTNNRVGHEIILTIGMTEANVQGSFPLRLEIDQPLVTVQEFFTRGEERRKEIKGAPELTVDIAKDIPQTGMHNPQAVAVVIGNRDYLKTAPVDFAVNDAQLVKQYLIRTFGFREENIIFEKNATQATFNSIFGTESEFRGKLYNYLKPHQSDVFIYYSGHGVPDPESHKAYFVPVDCGPTFARLNGYSLDLFYENLSRLPARTITVVIDACFSGISERGNLISNISPGLLRVETPLLRLSHGLVMTAAANDQVASWYPEKKHSLFTYFFLKGLKGEGDLNRDGQLTFGELQEFIHQNVPYLARRLNNREQTPDFWGDANAVLVEY